jgi:hypothetical protein
MKGGYGCGGLRALHSRENKTVKGAIGWFRTCA